SPASLLLSLCRSPATSSIHTRSLHDALPIFALLTPMWWYQARTSPHVAQLAEAGGLVAGDPVYVAGVPAGRVEEVTLADEHVDRSEEHTSELQSRFDLVCRLLLEKKNTNPAT